jgi:hypothetical protein
VRKCEAHGRFLTADFFPPSIRINYGKQPELRCRDWRRGHRPAPGQRLQALGAQ